MVLLLKLVVYNITKLIVLDIYFSVIHFLVKIFSDSTMLTKSNWFHAFIYNLFCIFPALSLVIFLCIAFSITFLILNEKVGWDFLLSNLLHSLSQVAQCQCRRCKRCGFDPWVRKIPWRRKWQPIPVFLPWEIPWTEKPGGLQSRRCKELDTTVHWEHFC